MSFASSRAPVVSVPQRCYIMDDVAIVTTPPPVTPLVASMLGGSAGTPSSSRAAATVAPSPSAMIQRCVVVRKQIDGYGLTVTGDHPVFVHTVKPDGAAYLAGVRQGDRILKVNGMPVTSSNHLEVVRMISGGQNVVLTLLGKPPEPMSYASLPVEEKPPDYRSVMAGETPSTPLEIRNISPIESARREEWKRRRKELLSQMLDDEKRNTESLRGSSAPPTKVAAALQRIDSLKSQLRQNEPVDPSAWRNAVYSSRPPMQVMNPATDYAIGTDEDEDDADNISEDVLGPFANLAELKSRPAYLSVFISHLLENANPSSLFFYLITDSYQSSSATVKDLRRWAFEIFSTFLIPNSPMLFLPTSDQSIIQPIDKVLAATSENVVDGDADQLRKLFLNARQKALVDINEHLADFRQKKLCGAMLDATQLAHISRGDRAMETRVGEQKLIQILAAVYSSANQDLDNCDPRTLAIIECLATIIRVVLGLKPNVSQWEKMLEKCPMFLAKDKSGKTKSKASTASTKLKLKGHLFVFNPVNVTHYCYQCRDAIWGVYPHAYFCLNCDVVIHKQCTSTLADACYGATQKVTPSSSSSRLKPKMKSSSGLSRDDDEATTPIAATEASSSQMRPEQNVKSTSSDSGIGADLGENQVARSQSMKARSEDGSRERRAGGRSALSWGAGELTPADENEERRNNRSIDMDDRATMLSTSSSRLFPPPGAAPPPPPIDVASVSGSSSISHGSFREEEAKKMLERVECSALTDGDSDLEMDIEIPSLDNLVGWEVIRHLKPKEKKRQEVINELFHTERTHVRNLKILIKVFYTPMLQKAVSTDVVHLLFSNIVEVLELHADICQKMRAAADVWRRDSSLNGLFGDVGELMESFFDGEAGERFTKVTSTFCQHQQHALDILRARCKKEKEDSLSRFLAEAESNPLCRKLQLKDMLPMEMQRLVKYPLLLETIAKYTNEPSKEQEKLLKVVAQAKKILSAVNTAKRNAENLRRLEELQRRLDTTPFDKENQGHDFASLDLTKFRLVHDGPLVCRFNKGKLIELHVVLLEDYVIMLTKHSDGTKLQLKGLEQSKESKWSPILPLPPLVAREKANDKRAFFLVFNSNAGSQIYELVAATATERKTWFKLMSEQIEHMKQGGASQTYNWDMGAGVDLGSQGADGSATIEKVHVLTHPRLVNASEITIQQPTILEHAQPVLTPMERLRRNDQVIFTALKDKHAILAECLFGDQKSASEELEKITEALAGLNVAELKQRDSRELAMSAIVHGNRLLDSINQGMAVRREVSEATGEKFTLRQSEEERNLPSVPCYRLTAIAAPLMNHLKAMMQAVQDLENENSALKSQLYHYKELAESGPRDRSVSEETLTETTTGEPKLMTKRTRTASNPPPL